MTPRPDAPLAELHLHLYGTIRAEDYLAYAESREADWTRYEEAYEEAYGTRPPLREILDRHGSGDPFAARDFKKLFVFGDEDGGNFERFQAKFNLLIGASEFRRLGQYEDPFPPLFREVEWFVQRMLADQRRQGIGYAEQRILLGARFPLDLARRVYEGMIRIYAEHARTGMLARLAVSLPREDPWPTWELVERIARGPCGEHLTGIDFCNVEEGHPPKAKREFFRAVHDFNERWPRHRLAILYHVGESFRDKSLESAVRWVQEAAEMGAHRLGHAIALGIDPESYGVHERTESVVERRDQLAYDLEHRSGLERHGVLVDPEEVERELRRLRGAPDDGSVRIAYDEGRLHEVGARQAYAMERVRATGAVIEVCPTSNRRIGAIDDPEHHPVHRFMEHGVPFVVGSDDPGIFDTGVREEIEWVVKHAGLASGAFEELASRAWNFRSEVVSGREPFC
jgi:hypothetical protein